MTQNKYSIILLNPPASKFDKSGWVSAEHLGLNYLFSYLTQKLKNINVITIDAAFENLTVSETIEKIFKTLPNFVGISCLQYNFNIIKRICTQIKKFIPLIKICLGGPFISGFGKRIFQFIPEIDFAISGEGERELCKLISYLINDCPKLPFPKYIQATPIDTLDVLPFPSRLYTLNAKQDGFPVAIQSSRGCYGKCYFCNTHIVEHGQWRARSSRSIIEELKELKRQFSIDRVLFVDDNFIGPKESARNRVIEFCDKIQQEQLHLKYGIACRSDDVEKDVFLRLRVSGLDWVFVGIESGSQSQLDRFNKNISVSDNIDACNILRNLGIQIVPGFIMFDAHVTKQEICNNINFIIEHLPECHFSDLSTELTVICGSKIERQYYREGILDYAGPIPSYKFINKEVATIFEAFRVITDLLNTSGLKYYIGKYRHVLYSGLNTGKVDQNHFLYKLKELQDIKIKYFKIYRDVVNWNCCHKGEISNRISGLACKDIKKLQSYVTERSDENEKRILL